MATSTNYNLVPVDVSPSLLYSNLAASSHGIVFAHKESVFGVDTAILHGSKDSKVRKIPNREQIIQTTQVSWLNFPSRSLLGVATRSTLYIYASDRTTLLLNQPLKGVADFAKIHQDHTAAHFFRGLATVPGSNRLVFGTSWGDAFIISVEGGGAIQPFSPESSSVLAGMHEAPITSIDANNKYIVTADDEGTIVQWCATTLKPLRVHEYTRTHELSTDAAIEKRRQIVQSSRASGVIKPVAPTVRTICTCISVREEVIVGTYYNGKIRVYGTGDNELYPGQILAEVDAHVRCINALSWHPTRPIFVVGSEDGTMTRWSIPSLSSSGTPGSTASTTTTPLKILLDSKNDIPDALITGVQILTLPGSNRTEAFVIVAVYDDPRLRVFFCL